MARHSDPIGLAGGSYSTYAYVDDNPASNSDLSGLFFPGPWVGPVVQGVVTAAATAAAAIGFGVVAIAFPTPAGDPNRGDEAPYNPPSATNSNGCPPNKKCPPCRTASGQIVPVGTIAYRSLDVPPTGTSQHGIQGPHYNLYKANQNPNNCQCFWQPVGAVSPSGLPPGAIPIEPFAN